MLALLLISIISLLSPSLAFGGWFVVAFLMCCVAKYTDTDQARGSKSKQDATKSSCCKKPKLAHQKFTVSGAASMELSVVSVLCELVNLYVLIYNRALSRGAREKKEKTKKKNKEKKKNKKKEGRRSNS